MKFKKRDMNVVSILLLSYLYFILLFIYADISSYKKRVYHVLKLSYSFETDLSNWPDDWPSRCVGTDDRIRVRGTRNLRIRIVTHESPPLFQHQTFRYRIS